MLFLQKQMYLPKSPGQYKFFMFAFVAFEFIGQLLLVVCFNRILLEEIKNNRLQTETIVEDSSNLLCQTLPSEDRLCDDDLENSKESIPRRSSIKSSI